MFDLYKSGTVIKHQHW